MSGCNPNEASFNHVVLEGTSYEVGRAQAERLREDPQRRAFLTPTLPFLERYSEREAQRELAYFDEHCPGDRGRGAGRG